MLLFLTSEANKTPEGELGNLARSMDHLDSFGKDKPRGRPSVEHMEKPSRPETAAVNGSTSISTDTVFDDRFMVDG